MRSVFHRYGIRKVGGTASRFFAILAITALGVAFFAGLRATAPDMRGTAQSYLESLNFMDMRVISTVGFNSSDVNAVRKVKGVRNVMPSYSADAMVDSRGESFVVKLYSCNTGAESGKPSDIDRPRLTEGRMPQKADECLADPHFMKASGCRVGERVSFYSGSGGGLSGTLKYSSYVITGVAENPLYISYGRGTSSIGNGRVDAYFYLPSGAFRLPVYTDLFLTLENPRKDPLFSEGYDDGVLKPAADELKKAGDIRTQARFDEIKSEARKKLDEAKKELAAGRQALADAKKKLGDAEAKALNGQNALSREKKEFARQISAAQAAVGQAQASYDSGAAQAAEKKKEIDAGLARYEEGVSRLESAKALLQQAGGRDSALQAQIAAMEAQLQESKRQLDEASAQLSAAEQRLAAAKRQIEASRRELSARQAEGEAQISAQQKKIDAALRQIGQEKTEYEKKEAEARPEFEKAAASISEGEKAAAGIKKPVWYVLDHNSNEGFVSFKQDADRISAISMVFPLIFFLVAALVTLTDMTRLVEDDRGTIGTLKALGYSRGSIAAQYLVYAVAASLAGSAAGMAAGFNLFPRVIFNAYRILYTLPPVKASFNTEYALVSAGAAVFCAAVPAFLVCIRFLRESPASLMRPKSPRPGKRILLERVKPVWKRFGFTWKVTARNLFRYKKRLVMTVTGVAGCTALLLTGFGLHDAISAIIPRQYGQIRTYDMQVDLKNSVSSAELSGLMERMAEQKNITGSAAFRQQSVDAWSKGGTKSVYLVTPQSGEDFSGYIDLRERAGHRKLKPDGGSVIVTEKLASVLNLKKGSVLHLRAPDGTRKDVAVGGIAENYVYHYVFMSPELYRKLFGTEPQANQIYCCISDKTGTAEDALSGALMKQEAVSSVSFTTGLRENFLKMIRAVNSVVVVLIISAALLAFVVLFSLTEINIDERRRELATIKVLGFFDRETASYIYRENTVLVIIGTVLGLLLGIVMERYVVVSSEVDLVMFGRDVLPGSYVYSALLTAFFAAAVNLMMFRRIKKVDMVASLKSAE